MKKTCYFIVFIILIFIFSSCAGIIGFKNPHITRGEESKKQIKRTEPVKFEDFENGTLVGSYSYGNKAGGASASYMISQENPHSGNYCAKAVIDTGTDSDWGCGFGAGTSYGAGFVDASDTDAIHLFIKAPEGMTFYVFCNEGAANNADGEFWNGPDMTGTGKWTEYIIPYDELHRNIYAGNQAGNNTFDPSAIAVIGIQLGGKQGKGELFVDDIYFK
jgi:hypothetical protein